MTRVTAQMSVSLDGFYAGPTSPDTDIHNWIGSEEALGFFRITRWVVDAMGWRERQGLEGGEDDTNSEILREGFESAGAYLMGRRMFDGGEQPWGDEPPGPAAEAARPASGPRRVLKVQQCREHAAVVVGGRQHSAERRAQR